MRARLAGVFYLLTIALGVFGESVTTAHNVAGAEQLFRVGMAADLTMLCAYVVVTCLLYELFKPVDAGIAALAAFFSIVGIATLATFSLMHLAALTVADDAAAALAIRLHGMGYDVSDVFFGVYCLLIGWLIVRSTLVPKAVGALMAIAGCAYLANSFADFVLPALGRAMGDYALLPALIGELALAFWLLIFGIKENRA
jgi:hypothetical protein